MWVIAAIISILLSFALVEWLGVGYKPASIPTAENQ
jgi:hypothetical protein